MTLSDLHALLRVAPGSRTVNLNDHRIREAVNELVGPQSQASQQPQQPQQSDGQSLPKGLVSRKVSRFGVRLKG
jgi:hypothetical protein